MQTLLIQKLLNPLCSLMGRFSEKAKDRLFLTGGVLILLQMFLRLTDAVEYRYAIHFVSCCFCLGLMILASLGTEVKPVKFRKPISILWFSAAILRILSGLRYNVDYLPEGALLLVGYPITFLCFANADRERIFRLLGKLCRIGILLYAAFSWLLVPLGWNKYSGIFDNANSAAYTLAAASAGLLLELLFTKKCRKGDFLLLGLSLALNFYTNSRSGFWALSFGLILSVGVYVLTHGPAQIKTCLLRLGALGLVSLVLVCTLVYPFQLRYFLPLPFLDTESGTFYTATREEILESISPDLENQLDGRIFFGISGFLHIADLKNDTAGKDLNAFSTGRMEIWTQYAKDLNWTGHPHVPPIYIGEKQTEIKTTHMVALQYAYESGIPMGAFYLAMNIATGIWGILYGWKHRKQPYALGPLMYTCVFGVLSVLGSCGASFHYLATLFYYLTLFPIITQPPEETP